MDRRALVVVAVLVVAGSYFLAGAVQDPAPDPDAVQDLDRDRLVQPAPNGSYLWPYTSKTRSVEGRTLAINVVVHGDDDRVRRTLIDRAGLRWDETDPEHEDANADLVERVVDEDLPSWSEAGGGTRYSYVDTGPHGGSGRWIDVSYQLHLGTYFGERNHIRAYTTDVNDWTAIQVHQEYYDWFTLGHTVTDITDSRTRMEESLRDEPYVEDLRREYHAVDRGWNDGWISVIELATSLPILGLGLIGFANLFRAETRRSMRRELRRFGSWSIGSLRGFILVGFLVATVLGVRMGAIFVESLGILHSHAIAATLYPVMVLLPLVLAVVFCRPLDKPSRFAAVERLVHRLGRPLDPLAAGGFAGAGLGLAYLLEFAALGVSALPIVLVVHRLGLLVALGIVGAGAARGGTEGGGLLSLGILAWLVGLALPFPLVGWI